MGYAYICQLSSVISLLCVYIPKFEVCTKGILDVPLLVFVIQVHAYREVLPASYHDSLPKYQEYRYREHYLLFPQVQNIRIYIDGFDFLISNCLCCFNEDSAKHDPNT